jgi:hypothetical protein
MLIKENLSRDELARIVREEYIKAREEYEYIRTGKSISYKPPPSFDGCKEIVTDDGVILEKGRPPVWYELVDCFIKNKITNPGLYIHTVFQDYYDSPYPPKPKDLLRPEYLQKWEQIKINKQAEIIDALKFQVNILDKELRYLRNYLKKSKVDALVCILSDHTLALSPLFRFCLAKRYAKIDEAFSKLARIYAKSAKEQFQKFPDLYTKYWDSILDLSYLEE